MPFITLNHPCPSQPHHPSHAHRHVRPIYPPLRLLKNNHTIYFKPNINAIRDKQRDEHPEEYFMKLGEG
jgi:hypothetical protein